MPSATISQICEILGVQPLATGLNTVVTELTTLDAAHDSSVSFLLRPKMRKQAADSRAALILIPDAITFDDPRTLTVPNVWIAILKLIEFFHPSSKPIAFIHPTAVVAEGTEIGEDVFIGPFVVIEPGVSIGDRTRIEAHTIIGANVKIGDDCLLHPRVTLASETSIGNRVIFQSGAVIGADGFKYEVIDRRLTKIPQIGRVVIEDDVEIGANTTIDRASFHETRIGARTKIDNLVMIAHNCQIGSDCILVSQTGIAGSTKLGRGVILGGQVGVADNVVIGDGVRVAAQSGIAGVVAPGAELFGSPAIDRKTYMNMMRVMRKLPRMYNQLLPYLEQMKDAEAEAENNSE